MYYLREKWGWVYLNHSVYDYILLACFISNLADYTFLIKFEVI